MDWLRANLGLGLLVLAVVVGGVEMRSSVWAHSAHLATNTDSIDEVDDEINDLSNEVTALGEQVQAIQNAQTESALDVREIRVDIKEILRRLPQ